MGIQPRPAYKLTNELAPLLQHQKISCRRAYNKYLSSLVDPNSNTVTKRLWTLIKNKKKDHTGEFLL